MVNPAGTVTGVRVTFPVAPTVTGAPFKVSLANSEAVVPPLIPLIAGVVSVTASIAGAATFTVSVAVSQTPVFTLSQI